MAALVHNCGEAVGATQGAQIPHHSVLPQERPRLCSTQKGEGVGYRVRRRSDHLAAAVYTGRDALISAQRSEIDDLTVLPKDGTSFREAGEWIDYAVF